MALDIKLKSLGMAQEQEQLEEILQQIHSSDKGDVLAFPEYAAYTREGSQWAYEQLSGIAVQNEVTIITTLNHPGADLPFSNPNASYNTLFIFSRNGKIHSPQAKITPQSFEMQHLDESYPKINVAPYSYLNRVLLRRDGSEFTVFFLICSDLYVLPLFDYNDLKADVICCPANFGNGAEESAGKVIEYSVNSGLFKQGFLCNTHQNVKRGRVPLTVGFARSYEQTEIKKSYNQEEMRNLVDKSSVVYPEERYRNFKSMLVLTQNGTFTVPRTRSLENGLKVTLGRYETVVEI